MMTKNNALEEKLKSGDIILVCARKFSFQAVPIKIANFFKRGYRNRGWTHAALYIGNGEVVEAFSTGIVQRNFKETYLNNGFNLLVLRHKKALEKDLEKVINFCVQEESKKYDFRGLIYFLLSDFVPQGLHFILENDFFGECFKINDSYFCSELISTGFLKADVYCFEREPYKVMPIDFYNHLWFDVVDKFEVPEKQKSVWHKIKVGVFHALYIFSAILFPVILIIVAHLLLIAAIIITVCVGIGIYVLSAFGKKERRD